jgi:hypothetical protein
MLERFAYLIAQQERERIAKKIEQLPFGDTAASFGVYVREALTTDPITGNDSTWQRLKKCLVGSAMLLLQAMHTILFSITNTYVFLYARIAIRVALTEYTDKLGFGRL